LDAIHFDPTRFDAAIVDLDGTMVDTLGDFVAALNGMLHDLRLPAVDGQAIRPMVGKGTEHLLGSVLRHVRDGAGFDAALLEQAAERYRQHYLAINGRYSQVYPGVAEGLAFLRRRGLRLACLTNKPGAFARPLLAAKGLDGYFAEVFGGCRRR
jgi:phosphoglycolate phosphatase